MSDYYDTDEDELENDMRNVTRLNYKSDYEEGNKAKYGTEDQPRADTK